jgi:hypothetical protein
MRKRCQKLCLKSLLKKLSSAIKINIRRLFYENI